MPNHVVRVPHLRPISSGTDRIVVYYEAKNREEFLELRERMRSDEGCAAVIIVVIAAILLGLFVLWMNKYQ